MARMLLDILRGSVEGKTMTLTRMAISFAAVAAMGLTIDAGLVSAQPRHQSSAVSQGRPVPRSGPSVVAPSVRRGPSRVIVTGPRSHGPRVGHGSPYVRRPYYGQSGGFYGYGSGFIGYRPGFSFGFSYGYPRYGYAYRRPYYPAYRYPYYGYYGSYGYPGYYGSPGYYAYPGYGAPAPEAPYGSLRLRVRPENAAVYVDGYYVGLVDDFDGSFQRLQLEPGVHRIEISAPGYQTEAFDVKAEPGRTIDWRGDLRPGQP